MLPWQAARVLLIVVVLAIIWVAFMVLQRPVLRSRGATGLDWGDVVGFPVLIVAIFMVSRYLFRRNSPAPRVARPGPGEAIATGLVWGIVQGIQERYTFGSLTIAPLISGAVVCVAVLLGNWIVARLSRD